MRGQKQEKIIRVLLNEKKLLSKNELSKKAECSRQWVILFLRQLEKKNLVRETKVIDPKKLMNYWIGLPKAKTRFKEYMIKDPQKILKNTKLEYTLTTYQAENLMQHYLFPSRIDIYVKDEDQQKWHQLLTKNGLYGKGNVRLIVSDMHISYNKRRINKLNIVSLPQLILDLYKEGGPCVEAAEMLMKKL